MMIMIMMILIIMSMVMMMMTFIHSYVHSYFSSLNISFRYKEVFIIRMTYYVNIMNISLL